MTLKNILIGSSLLALAACGGTRVDISGGHYWQRANMQEAVYAQGPASQRALNQDIADCVVEMRELGRSTPIKNAIPNDPGAEDMTPDQRTLADWDTPDHDGSLLAEHSDAHDFEGCMLGKGWERVGTMPYNVAEKGVVNYYKAHVDYGYDPRTPPAEHKQDAPSSNDAYNQ